MRPWESVPARPAGYPTDILENIDGGSLADLGALAESIRISDGYLTPSDRPGHGIVFDRAVLAAHAVDT
jgi:L-alanine-DL-glutamate epimerase-like enolase superfamily enzyme